MWSWVPGDLLPGVGFLSTTLLLPHCLPSLLPLCLLPSSLPELAFEVCDPPASVFFQPTILTQSDFRSSGKERESKEEAERWRKCVEEEGEEEQAKGADTALRVEAKEGG